MSARRDRFFQYAADRVIGAVFYLDGFDSRGRRREGRWV